MICPLIIHDLTFARSIVFYSMPVSSVLDNKDRVMGGGVNSAGRKKGSRNINTWDSEDGSSSSNEEHDVAS